MRFSKSLFILAAVLTLCSALLFQATPSFASDNITVNVDVVQTVTVGPTPPAPPADLSHPPFPPAPPIPPGPVPPYYPPAPPVYHPPAPVYIPPSYSYNCCYTDPCLSYTGCYTGPCYNYEYCSVGLHPDYCYGDCCHDSCRTDPCYGSSCITTSTTTTTTTTDCGTNCTTPTAAPLITSFSASPSSINPGQQVVLSWAVSGADTLLLSPGVGAVSSTGSFTVTPTATTTYTLTATKGGNSVNAITTVTVTPMVSYTQSTTTQAVAAATPSNSSFLTMGIGGENGLPLYILFIILLIAATIGIILYMRRPVTAPANAEHGLTSIRLGPYASVTTLDTPSTAVIGHGIRGKLFASSGAQVTIPASGILGRDDFRDLASGKASMISRQHVRVSVDHGEYYIEDRNSTNGTLVNGTSINGRGRLLLKNGDEIELANAIKLKFKS